MTWQEKYPPSCHISISDARLFSSSSATPLPQYSPQEGTAETRRSRNFLPWHVCGFRLGIISGLVRNITDFFLEADGFTAEERSGGCFAGQRGGRPQGGGAAGTTGKSENTGFSQSKETASILVPICRRKNLLRCSITR